MNYNRADVLLEKSFVLPATGTTTSPVLDLQELATQTSVRDENVCIGITIPPLSATNLPASTSFSGSVELSDTEDFAVIRERHEFGPVSGPGPISTTRMKARVSPQSPRYARGKLTASGSVSVAGINATFGYLF